MLTGSLALHCFHSQVLCIKTIDEILHQLIRMFYPIYDSFYTSWQLFWPISEGSTGINLHFPALGVGTSQSNTPVDWYIV